MPYSNPEAAAQALLDETWNDTIPVDPVRIARALGITVIKSQLSKDTSGALMKEVGQDPVIVLNRDDHPNRQRFTCAHELGHFVQRSDMPEKYAYIDKRNSMSSTGKSPEERYANAFASALLMPARHVRRLEKQGLRGDLQLALQFDVSREAMAYRLKKLGG